MFYNKQKGFSLVELMVGLVIGLLAIYATYRIYENVEANQRVAETVNDAQISGLYAIFTLEQEIGNAGAIIANTPNRNAFTNCDDVMTFPTIAIGATGSLPLFPAPVAIERTGNNNFDMVHVYYGTSPSNFMLLPVNNGGAPGTNDLTVQAPLGVRVGDTLVVDSRPCRVYRVATSIDPNVNGMVALTLDAPTEIASGASVLDLGAVGRRSFYVDNGGTLQMAVWQVANTTGAPGNNWSVQRIDPIISNVVFFRAQYGVDSNGDGVVDLWMNAGTSAGELDLAQVLSSGGTIESNDIKSVRVAVIVQADQPDRELANAANFRTTVFQGGGAGAQPIGPLTFSVGDGAFGWRYRQYETIIPLINTVWNPNP